MGAAMTLEKRLVKLEAVRGVEPDPKAEAAFAELVAALDRLAARKAAGDVTAGADLEELAAMVPHGRT